jgi:hypothetical protein
MRRIAALKSMTITALVLWRRVSMSDEGQGEVDA